MVNFVAATGQEPWPSPVSFVAASGQFSMAANRGLSRRLDTQINNVTTWLLREFATSTQ